MNDQKAFMYINRLRFAELVPINNLALYLHKAISIFASKFVLRRW
jgi:hypothetical protein